MSRLNSKLITRLNKTTFVAMVYLNQNKTSLNLYIKNLVRVYHEKILLKCCILNEILIGYICNGISKVISVHIFSHGSVVITHPIFLCKS